ncbi:MAG: hypothetical protein RRY09_07955, partial [Oscillospiraceae bacterium]
KGTWEPLIKSVAWIGEQIFCPASQKHAGILTYFKGFWRCPDGKDAVKTCGGIYSEAPLTKRRGLE